MIDRRLIVALSIAAAAAFVSACASSPERASGGSESGSGAPVFVDDDFAGSMAAAKAAGKPLFVDTWAPWCHSCLALKTQVLVDPKLAVVADQFAWASLDTERASSAEFIAKFPPPAMPTLYVIDPRDGSLVLRWVGTATADQLVELLKDARAAFDGHGTADATALLLEGDVKAAAKDDEGAIAAWKEALAKSPADWPKRARATDALLFALSRADKNEECATIAAAELPHFDRLATGRPDVAIGGYYCASELDAGAQKDALTKALRAHVEAVAEDDRLLTDDRSGAFEALVEGTDAATDKAARVALAKRWQALLDKAASAAKTPAERAAYDPHRMLAYLAADEGAKALPMLAQSAKDFPDDYNPWARTAYTLLQLGRLDEALAASAKAEALVYGPRSLRVWSVRADIDEKRGDTGAAMADLDKALAAAEALPEAQRSAKVVKLLTDRRAKLAATVQKAP